MAQIEFYANVYGGPEEEGQKKIEHQAPSSSGIGFYGSEFGVSVPIGSQQETTFVTNANGTAKGIALNNTKYANDYLNNNDNRDQSPGKVVASDYGTAKINLNEMPNYLCPLNIRFTHNTAVRVQNCKLRIFDRNNIDNHASGVVTYVYEARHPSITVGTAGALAHKAPGVTSDKWFIFEDGYRNDGNTAVDNIEDMPFTNSPGVSGLNTISVDTALAGVAGATQQGATHRSLRHDWYVALSSEPITIGSKTQYGLYFSVEYL
jgi:hypothetical protein